MVSLVFLASFALAAGGFFWALAALNASSGNGVILHFSDLTGITAVGDFNTLIAMGILGIAIVVVNFFVALSLEERDGVLGKIVAAVTLVMAVLLFIAFAAIIKVN